MAYTITNYIYGNISGVKPVPQSSTHTATQHIPCWWIWDALNGDGCQSNLQI